MIGWIALGLLGILALTFAAAFIAAALIPAPVPPSSPDPATDYDEAIEKVDALMAKDASDDIGYPTIFMDHGSMTTTVVVIFHGYTNNPKQFEKLGRIYHEAGYNVLIPRLPGHGAKDVLSKTLSDVDAAVLVEATDEAIDIAAGLGENVEVIGISGGGTLATWAAYNRDEVDTLITISPFFATAPVPVVLTRPITEILHVLPDFYVWWDPALKEKHLPPTGYPRFSTRSLTAFLDVGYSIVDDDPQRTTPLKRAIYISNASDDSVNGQFGADVFREQIAPIADAVSFHEFDASLSYAHDLVDPAGLNAEHLDEIYSQLEKWMEIPTPPE